MNTSRPRPRLGPGEHPCIKRNANPTEKSRTLLVDSTNNVELQARRTTILLNSWVDGLTAGGTRRVEEHGKLPFSIWVSRRMVRNPLSIRVVVKTRRSASANDDYHRPNILG